MSTNKVAMKDRATVKHLKPAELEVTMEIPANGLRLKFLNKDKNVVGTIIVQNDGIMVLDTNQRKPPETVISWSNLARLMTLGLLKG